MHARHRLLKRSQTLCKLIKRYYMNMPFVSLRDLLVALKLRYAKLLFGIDDPVIGFISKHFFENSIIAF